MTAPTAAIEDLESIELQPSDQGNLVGTDTGRQTLSHSSLNLALNCLRKYEFAKVHRLEPISRRRPLDMGRAFQKAIELQDPAAGAALLREGARVLSQEDEERLQIEETTVLAGARLYMDRWPSDEEEAREQEYLVRLRNPWTGAYSRTFDLHGFADGVLDGENQSYLELIENKFVGQIDAVTVKKLKLDRQISLACYGLWRATGKRVARVHYRYVRRPSIKRRKGRRLKDGTLKGAETHDQFLARIEQDYRERPDHYSHEETLFRSDADLLRVEAELWTWAEQIRAARRDRLYPRNTTHCSDWGGCEFLPLCCGDPDAITLYQVRPTREETDEAA